MKKLDFGNETIESNVLTHMEEYNGIVFNNETKQSLMQLDTSRWLDAKWYQKLFGFFFSSYKVRFIDCETFNLQINPRPVVLKTQDDDLLDDNIFYLNLKTGETAKYKESDENDFLTELNELIKE